MNDRRGPAVSGEGRLRELLAALEKRLPPGWAPGWSDGQVSVSPRERKSGRFSVTWLEGFGRFAAFFRPPGADPDVRTAEFEPGPGVAAAIAAWMVREARS